VQDRILLDGVGEGEHAKCLLLAVHYFEIFQLPLSHPRLSRCGAPAGTLQVDTLQRRVCFQSLTQKIPIIIPNVVIRKCEMCQTLVFRECADQCGHIRVIKARQPVHVQALETLATDKTLGQGAYPNSTIEQFRGTTVRLKALDERVRSFFEDRTLEQCQCEARVGSRHEGAAVPLIQRDTLQGDLL
jgi:hypothetical protein